MMLTTCCIFNLFVCNGPTVEMLICNNQKQSKIFYSIGYTARKQEKNTIESPAVARKNALELTQFSLQYCFQGHPRSMISISSEKAYATSY